VKDIAVVRERLLTEAAVQSAETAFAAGRAIARRESDEADLTHVVVKGYDASESAVPFWQ
jgi:hypothetical protein